jgi:dihydroorotase
VPLRLLHVFAFLLVPSALLAQQRFDLLLKGGRVIDSRNNIDTVMDIGILDHKIAAVERKIDASKADKVIDLGGLIVTPGLVDIHAHVYAGTGLRGAYDGDNSVYPDGFTFRSCVTTVADAGSSGWRNFPDFKDRIIDRSKTRVLAFLNIVGAGMGGKVEQDTAQMDPTAAAEMAKRFPNIIVGFKTAHFEGPEWTSVDRALEAGKLASLPIMVDFGNFRPERPYPDLVSQRLRPGDISTHMYIDFIPMLDSNGHVNAYLLEAQKRGVIFDVGHGGGSFAFNQAVPAVEQGFLPNSISTDLHIGSMNAGMKEMTNVMSKFLNLGMSLPDVIARSAWQPAREIHHEDLGSLSVGSEADVAVLRLEQGRFGFVDSLGGRMEGSQKLVCELTLRAGRVVWDLNGLARGPWQNRTKYSVDPKWDGLLPPRR